MRDDAARAVGARAGLHRAPTGVRRTRHGLFARVRVEDYGPGRIRPHERTHPGPKEDRLRLTRATRANLSPIFSLYDDRRDAAWGAVAPHLERRAVGRGHRRGRHRATASGGSPTRRRAPRSRAALAGAELLIADGHHRYETARVYARSGGEGGAPLRADVPRLAPGPGPDRLPHPPPAHRPRRRPARGAARRDRARLGDRADRRPTSSSRPATARVRIGYYDAHHKRPLMLTLKDQAIADAALPDKPEPYRRLDTAVLEALILQGALGMTEDDISHFNGLDYARSTEQARARVGQRRRPRRRSSCARTPVEQVRDVAGRRGEHAAEVDLLLPQGPDRHGVQSAGRDAAPTMRHASRRTPDGASSPTTLKVREHQLTADEPEGRRRRRPRPQPAGAARRVAGLVHGDHDGDVRQAQGLEHDGLEVDVRLQAGRARLPDPLRARS